VVRRPVRGFSLVELLVVIAIVGVMAAAVTLSLRPASVRESMDKALLRLSSVMQLALDEAQIQGRELGLRLDSKGYGWLVLTEGQWLPITDDVVYADRGWPEDVQVYLKLENFGFSRDDERQGGLGLSHIMASADTGEEQDQQTTPQVIISSSGEVTPFQLILVADDVDGEAWYARLSVDFTGSVEQTRARTERLPTSDFQVLVP
jgi:general secretion pathway protein H